MPLHEQDIQKLAPTRINVSGGGFVELVSVLGSDAAIDTIARTEFDDSHPRLPDAVHSLISYLMRNGHMSAFAFANMTLRVRCPMFLRARWEHRCGQYNEISNHARDLSELGAYVPSRDQIKAGHKSMSAQEAESWHSKWSNSVDETTRTYAEATIVGGVSREVAAGLLSQSNFTHFYVQLSLQGLLNFLQLRMGAGSSVVMREYVDAVAHFVSVAFPIVYRNFLIHVINAVKFSADELEFVGASAEVLRTAEARLGRTRALELLAKVEKLRAKTH